MFFVRCTLLATPPTSSPIPSPGPTPTPALDSVAGFYLWQEQLESAPLADRPYLVNNYLAQLTTTPLTDDKTAIFLWEGFARSVQLMLAEMSKVQQRLTNIPDLGRAYPMEADSEN